MATHNASRIPSAIRAGTRRKFIQKPFRTKFLIPSEDLSQAVGIEKQAGSGREFVPLALVAHSGQKAQGRAGGIELDRRLARRDQEPGIMAGIDHLDFARGRMQPEKDRRDVAPARLLALGPVVLVHARGQFVERRPGDGHAAKCRAEAGGHDGRGQPLAGHVGHGNQQAAVGLLDNIEIVAAHFVAGVGAEGDRIAGDLGQRLRKQRALNLAGRVQILLQARELNVALVIARVFKRNGGLEDQALKEVGFRKRETRARREKRRRVRSSFGRRGRQADT